MDRSLKEEVEAEILSHFLNGSLGNQSANERLRQLQLRDTKHRVINPP